MPAQGVIPLGLESYNRGLNPEVELINLIVEEDKSGMSPDRVMRLKRPGLKTRFQTDGAARGLFQQDGVFDGRLFAVYGNRFGTAGSSFVSQGTIAGGPMVAMAATFEQLAVVADPKAYSWNGTSLTPVQMPDDRVVVDVETLNGYVIYACPEGQFYWTAPGGVNPDALNYATAESSPDGLIGVCRVVDELWFFGRTSVEVWQTTGNADLPFVRAPGRQYDRGCLHRDTIQRFDNSVFWVGEDSVVYRGDAVPNRLSTFSIEERIRQRVGDLIAFTCQLREHKFYMLRIPGQGTFGYDPASSQWSRFATEGDILWLPKAAAGNAFAGDFMLTDINPVYMDDDKAVRCVVSGTVSLTGKPDRFDSMTVGIGSNKDCTLNIRWKDGQDEYPKYSDEYEVRAPYDLVKAYRMGRPDTPSRTYELMVLDADDLRISGAMLGTAWG